MWRYFIDVTGSRNKMAEAESTKASFNERVACCRIGISLHFLREGAVRVISESDSKMFSTGTYKAKQFCE